MVSQIRVMVKMMSTKASAFAELVSKVLSGGDDSDSSMQAGKSSNASAHSFEFTSRLEERKTLVAQVYKSILCFLEKVSLGVLQEYSLEFLKRLQPLSTHPVARTRNCFTSLLVSLYSHFSLRSRMKREPLDGG